MGLSPTRPPCHQLLALLANDAVGHFHATRHAENEPGCRWGVGGGGCCQVCRLHDRTLKTILAKSTGAPLLVGEMCSLSIGTDAVSAVGDEPRAICIFCPR